MVFRSFALVASIHGFVLTARHSWSYRESLVVVLASILSRCSPIVEHRSLTLYLILITPYPLFENSCIAKLPVLPSRYILPLELHVRL